MHRSAEDNMQPVGGWSPVTDRVALRKALIAHRAALGAVWQAEASATLQGRLQTALQRMMNMEFSAPKRVVALYWPIRGEPDVRSLADLLRAQGVVVALPVVQGEAQPLQFHVWDAAAPLQADRYGIPTPQTGAWVRPDLIVLPGNAFDVAGYRLGYGAGYYDRTLAALKPRPLSIGVAYAHACLPDLQPQAHDLPVDWVVTEKTLWHTALNR